MVILWGLLSIIKAREMLGSQELKRPGLPTFGFCFLEPSWVVPPSSAVPSNCGSVGKYADLQKLIRTS